MSISILRIRKVMDCTGLGRSTVYKKAADPDDDFPSQVKLSESAAGWVQSEIEEWIARRVKESRDRAA